MYGWFIQSYNMENSPVTFKSYAQVSFPQSSWKTREFWLRRLPTYIMAPIVKPSALVFPNSTRSILNKIAGDPVFLMDQRMMPDNRSGAMGIIYSPGGCEWASFRHGGCTFCSFEKAVNNYVGNLPLSAREFKALFFSGFHTMSNQADMLAYFTAGSALNRSEIPEATLVAIAKAVAKAPKVRWLRLESRVQHFDENYINQLNQILAAGGSRLDLAIGFETKDDHIRNNLMNKGLTLSGFEKAVEVAKRAGVRLTCYVMLKGHWLLKENSAIDECVRSIKYLDDLGVDEVQLQPLYVSPDDGLMYRAWQQGLVRPPWLWSILEVLSRVDKLKMQIMMGPWDNEIPAPVASPANCLSCTPAILNLFNDWRKHGSIASLLDHSAIPDCSCKKIWEHECRDGNEALPE